MNRKMFLRAAKIYMFVLAFMIGFTFAIFAQGSEIAKIDPSGNVTPKIGGTIQMLGEVEYIKGMDNSPSDRQDARLYLFLKQARLNVSGKNDGIDYYVQFQMGGEEVPNGSNSVFSLLDAYIDAPLISKTLGLRVGQFKVPFSREMLTDPNSLQFIDTSANTTVFNIQRDVGLVFHGQIEDLFFAFGTFTGGGIDIPQRNIPQKLGFPQLVARVGFDTLDRDVLLAKQSDRNRKGTGFAAYISGSYEKNSTVGHGNVFANKKTDLSWFKNTAWNPNLNQVPGTTPVNSDYITGMSLTQIEADVAFQTEIEGFKFYSSAEANYGKFFSRTGGMVLKGGVAQIAVSKGIFEIAGRYAVIIPDERAGYYASSTGTGLGPVGFYPIFKNKNLIHEINPAVNIYFTNSVTLKMDLDIWIDAPVMQEAASGAYNLMIMPQTSYAQKTAPAVSVVERQTTFTARMIAQLVF